MSSQLQVSGEAKIRDIQGPVVANDGVITALDGAASQYVRGDGTLADFPTSGGGGSSVSYYLNGSVNQGTFGGSTYYQMSKNAIVGTGTNFSTSANGLIAQFITDANDPDVVSIPSGNWNVEFFMSVSASSGALASFYVEIYKYNGSTFTLLATNVATPEQLTNTTTVDAYFTSVAMPLSAMAVTDRLAVRIFANVASKTVTLYTEDNRLCQIVTTFSNGLTSLNNLTDQSQYLAVGTSGTDFNIASSGDTHTFNIPSASLTNRGLVTTGSQTFAGAKTFENNLNINGQLFVFGATGYGGGVSYRQGNILATSDGSTTLEFPDANSIKYYVGQGSNTYKNFIFDVANITTGATRTYNLPDVSGTLALTSDLNGYVPYSGAVMGLDLGVYSYNGNSVIINGNGSTQNGTLLFKQVGGLAFNSVGYSGIGILGTTSIHFNFNQSSGVYKQFNFNVNALTNNTLRTINIPDASGTIALTSDLSSYVPYTGATTNVDLGASNNLSANNISALGSLKSDFGLLLKSGLVSTVSGYLNISAQKISGNSQLNVYTDTGFSFSLSAPNNANYTYSFPSSSGTVALTSNLSAYLPLTGGTLTGALSGTSATFSGSVTFGANNRGFIREPAGDVEIGGAAGAALKLYSNNVEYAKIAPSTGFTTTLPFGGTSATFSSSVGVGGAPSGTYGTLSVFGGISTKDDNNGKLEIGRYSSGAPNSYIKIGTNSGSLRITNAADTIDLVSFFNSGFTFFGTIPSVTNYIKYNFNVGTNQNIGFRSSSSIARLEATNDAVNANVPMEFAASTFIFTGGNVGIGTSSPEANSQLTLYGSSFSQLHMQNGTTGTGSNGFRILMDGNNLTMTNREAGYWAFETNDTERMRITSGGLVLIGATSGTAAYKLKVDNGASGGILAVSSGGGDANFNSSSSGIGYHFFADNGTSARFYVLNNGDVRNTNNSYGAISDISLKENITDATPKLDDLLKVKIRNYNLIDDEAKTKQIGVIAQELEEVFPNMISEDKQMGTDETIKTVKYSVFVPMLIKAIQEQQAQIEELKAKTNRLFRDHYGEQIIN